LRPGTYFLKEGIHVETLENVDVSIETMELPRTLYCAPPFGLAKTVVKVPSELSEQPLPIRSAAAPPKRPVSFRSLFSCSQNTATEESETDDMMIEQEDSFEACDNHMQCAKLVLRTRKLNEPVFCIRQGGITLKRLYIQHQAPGVDIWNGNAAIQIQPPLGEDGLPLMVLPSPFCTMESCTVSSQSGRGIVNIDGGTLSIAKCMVKDCAATGIYIGGPGSSASIESSDVIRNGVGNRGTRRGIARGHSGIYLEQGEAKITNSNISDNTLTGISVVSPENAKLSLRDSSLVANGTFQLELPPPGTRTHQQSVHENNQLEFLGVALFRSGLSHDG
jgi:Right handed beta helix region